MIPNTYSIKKYMEIPPISKQMILRMVKNGQQFVFYDELVISLKEFNHPGERKIMEPYINNLNLNIKEVFKKYDHSSYAQLIVSLRTIGKLDSFEISSNSQQNYPLQGKQLFQRINQSDKFRLHQKTIQKIDFSKPIYGQIDALSVEEKQIINQLPTFVQNYQKVLFKTSPWEELKYTNNFWVSSLFFQFVILGASIYLFSQQNMNIVRLFKLLPFFLFGLLKWTFLEYYFHRFQLHYSLSENSLISHHMMHHIFPQMQNKIAQSIHKVAIYMVGFWLFYSIFLQKDQVLTLLLGTLIGLTLYDIIHYYVHFGPQTNIYWINFLKRNHLKHHYRNQNRGFGVSSTIWDRIFGTEHGRQNIFAK